MQQARRCALLQELRSNNSMVADSAYKELMKDYDSRDTVLRDRIGEYVVKKALDETEHDYTVVVMKVRRDGLAQEVNRFPGHGTRKLALKVFRAHREANPQFLMQLLDENGRNITVD